MIAITQNKKAGSLQAQTSLALAITRILMQTVRIFIAINAIYKAIYAYII
jgi:hypothetical protein